MQRDKKQALLVFVDGPRAGEREALSAPAPDTYDCEVLLNELDGYPLVPGQPEPASVWQKHRYRLQATGSFGPEDGGVCLYKHVAALDVAG